MKKYLILATLFGLISASGAFAATADISTATTIGGGSFTPSAKVGIKLISTTTSYAATSCHVSGTYQYGTVGGAGVTGDPSKILKKAIPAQSTAVGVPDAPTDATTIGAGWE